MRRGRSRVAILPWLACAWLWTDAAPARAQVACSTGGAGLFMPADDLFGSYSYFGGAALDGVPALEFATGTGHDGGLGTELVAAVSSRGMLIGLMLRSPIVRAGLDAPWVPGGAAPSMAFVLTPRFGLAALIPSTRNFGGWLGVDAEWLVAGQLLFAVRSGLFLPFDAQAAFLRPIPMVSVAVGFAPASAYGWTSP